VHETREKGKCVREEDLPEPEYRPSSKTGEGVKRYSTLARGDRTLRKKETGCFGTRGERELMDKYEE